MPTTLIRCNFQCLLNSAGTAQVQTICLFQAKPRSTPYGLLIHLIYSIAAVAVLMRKAGLLPYSPATACEGSKNSSSLPSLLLLAALKYSHALYSIRPVFNYAILHFFPSTSPPPHAIPSHPIHLPRYVCRSLAATPPPCHFRPRASDQGGKASLGQGDRGSSSQLLSRRSGGKEEVRGHTGIPEGEFETRVKKTHMTARTSVHVRPHAFVRTRTIKYPPVHKYVQTYLPPSLPACLPAFLPACLPACLLACLPASLPGPAHLICLATLPTPTAPLPTRIGPGRPSTPGAPSPRCVA
jgi:hypothetical protein